MTDLTPERLEEIREKREAAKQIVGKKPGRHYARPTITLADIDWLLAALDAERARNRNLEAVAEAARTLNMLHRDVLGLPTLSQDNLDAAAEAWAVLRAALAVLEEPPA